MRTHKNLFDRVCFFENLHKAYLRARKGKRYRKEILKFSYNLEENLLKLREELLSQSYRHGGYYEFIVNDSKRRKIKAAPFRDRAVHHALCNVIEPIFDKGFIYDSYACRKEKGTHRAVKRLEKFIKSADKNLGTREVCATETFCLQCDISKYFQSVDHEILFNLIKRKIADKKVLWLIQEVLNSSYDKEPTKGIPIGNLTSQLFANIYLGELDQFVKHRLQAGYYLRYMDDFIILDKSKRKLHQLKEKIQTFLLDDLNLKLHPQKANVFPAGKGIDFLGYLVFKDYKLLRKDTVKRFIRRTRIYQKKLNQELINNGKINQSIQSWLNYAKFGNSWRLRKKLGEELNLKLI